MNLVVHIERVVLDGVVLDGHQRELLRLCLERELAGHLAGRALTAELADGAAVPRLSAAPVQLDPAGPAGVAADLAYQVAGSVAATLVGPPATPAGPGARPATMATGSPR